MVMTMYSVVQKYVPKTLQTLFFFSIWQNKTTTLANTSKKQSQKPILSDKWVKVNEREREKDNSKNKKYNYCNYNNLNGHNTTLQLYDLLEMGKYSINF